MSTDVNERYADASGISLLAEDQYKREVAWAELNSLTSEEEIRLFAQMIRSHREPVNQWRAALAKGARARVVEAYQPVVFGVALSAVRRVKGLEFMDAVSEANIGLLTAIDDYVSKCWDRQQSFKALAITCMRQEIWRAFYMRGGLFSLPHYQANLLSRLHRHSAQFLHEYGYEPSVSDLADLMEVSEEEVQRLQSLSRTRASESLQALISEEEDASDRLDFTPVFQSGCDRGEGAVSPLKQAVRDAVVNDLSPRQREAVVQVYGFSDERVVAAAQMVSGRPVIQSRHLADYEKFARERLRHLLQPVLDGRGRDEELCEEYYSTKEVAEVLGVTRSTVKHRAAQGHLPVKRVPALRGTRAHVLRFPKRLIDALVVAEREEVSA